jgi:hypothetical protein
MRVILINDAALNQAFYTANVQKGRMDQTRRGINSQISDTKNPGLSTRVFAIDPK